MTLNISKKGKQSLEKQTLVAIPKYGNFISTASVAWQELHQCIDQKSMTGPKTKMMGISFGHPTEMRDDQLSYLAAITIENDQDVAIAAPLIKYELAGGAYEVFRYTGSYEYLSQVYGEILEANQFDMRDGAFIELYINTPNDVSMQDLITDIYIPVN